MCLNVNVPEPIVLVSKLLPKTKFNTPLKKNYDRDYTVLIFSCACSMYTPSKDRPLHFAHCNIFSGSVLASVSSYGADLPWPRCDIQVLSPAGAGPECPARVWHRMTWIFFLVQVSLRRFPANAVGRASCL